MPDPKINNLAKVTIQYFWKSKSIKWIVLQKRQTVV